MNTLVYGTRKRPYTTKELFEEICHRISVPGTVEYVFADRAIEFIDTYEFSIQTSLNFGACEGIFLSFYAKTENHEEKYLGSFKTLYESKEAMITMGKLAGEFIYETNQFVNENISDFSWHGYEVYYNGAFRLEISKRERVIEVCSELSEKYDDVRLLYLPIREEINWVEIRKEINRAKEYLTQQN